MSKKPTGSFFKQNPQTEVFTLLDVLFYYCVRTNYLLDKTRLEIHSSFKTLTGTDAVIITKISHTSSTKREHRGIAEEYITYESLKTLGLHMYTCIL